MKKIFILILLSELLISSQITLQNKRYNMTLKGGTLGLGIDVSTPIDNTYTLRLNINGLKKNHPIKTKYNTFEGDFKMYTAGILIDYYPIDNPFKISTGIYANSSNYDGTDSKRFVDVNIHATYNKIAPYIGIGWSDIKLNKNWGFTFDLGILYQGKANITSDISALGMHFKLKDELDEYSIVPVVDIGINYTF